MARIYYRRAVTGFPAPLPPGPPAPQLPSSPAPRTLLQQRADELGEAVPGSIEAALHRAQVAPRDVGNLGVALAFQLAQHEDGAVVCRQLRYALVHGLFEEALAVQVVGPGRGVFEL